MQDGLLVRFVTAADDVAACFALRTAVFVDEQGVSQEEEYDGRDDTARHILATRDGVPVAAARIRTVDGMAKIERVCVALEQRGTGAGLRLMEFVLEELRKDSAVSGAKLGSQIQAVGFYRRLGFEAQGPEYIDAGIPHVEMIRVLA